MVDFRYHALSLVAVFLALGIGIVLGVTVGDSLVSNADRNLRDSLRDDLTEAREQAREEGERAQMRQDVIDEMLPQFARGRLRGRAIAVVATGELPGATDDAIEEAVELAGGSIRSKTELAVPEDLDDLVANAPARGALRIRIAPDDGDASRLGARIGRAIALGSRRLRALRETLPQRLSGTYSEPADGIVFYRHPPPEPGDDQESAAEAELRDTFDAGLVEGLRFGQPVVGVESEDTDPSQVGWYDDHATIVASVDNIGTPEGQLALVLTLAGRGGDAAKGRFGTKDSADRPIPDLSD